MQRRYSFARKNGISCNLKKITDKYDRKNGWENRRIWEEHEDVLFNSKPVLYIMRELLLYTHTSPATRKMDILKAEYSRYCETHRKVAFQIEDLFRDGWLNRRIDEWQFSFLYGMQRLDTKNEKLQTKQTVCFLKALQKKIWNGPRLLKVDVSSIKLQKFLEQCGVDEKWLVKHAVLCRKQGEYYIDPFSEIWKKYGQVVISEYISRYIGQEQVFGAWMDLAAAFPRCSVTDILVRDLEPLYGACIAYLERETGTWEKEELCFSVFVRVEQGKLSAEKEACQGRDRYHTWERRCSFWYQYENLYGTRQGIAFRFCIERYFEVSRELAAKFRKLLKVPAYYLNFFCIHIWGNTAVFTDCLEEDGIAYEAAVSLHKYLMHDASGTGSASMEDLHSFGTCIQDVLYNDIFLSQKHSDGDRYGLFINWMLYLYKFEGRHLMDFRQTGFPRRKKADLYQGLLEWISKELLPVPRKTEALMKVFEERIQQCEDVTVHCYLGMAVDTAGVCEGSRFIDQEQVLDIFLNIFMAWCGKVLRKNLSIFSIDWDMFNQNVWGGLIAVHAEVFFEKFLCSYHAFMKTLWEDGIDAGTSEKSKMYLIYCYIAAFSLERFREALPEKQGLCLENILSQDFLAVHKKFGFFTGDGISHLSGKEVVAECMKGLLAISDAGRAEFAKGLRLLQSPDMLFWDGCADCETIREAYIDVLSDLDVEAIKKAVYSITMYMQMADQILQLSFALMESGAVKEGQLADKLAKTAEMILQELETQKGNPYVEKNKEWMETAKYRLLIIQGKKEEVLAGADDFYKGIIYMHSGDYENLRKAEGIFSGFFNRHSVHGTINYMITLAMLILKGDEERRDISQDWEKFQMVTAYFISNWDIFPQNKQYIFYYALLVDMKTGNRADAWRMEQLLKQDKDYGSIIRNSYVAKALVSFYAAEGEEVLAQEVIARYDKTGEKTTADEMRGILKEKGRQYDRKAALAGSPGISLKDLYDKELLKHVVLLVKGSEMDTQAYVMLPRAGRVAENEYQNYESSRLSGITVVHILHMVFQAVCKLLEYKNDYLRNGRLAREDTYNRFFMRQLNDMNALTGYVMADQSQGGKTGNRYPNGEMVPGERDHILRFGNQEIMLVEGIRQNGKSIIKKAVADHIKKLENYNASGMSLALVLIYAGFDDMHQQWEKYMALLETYQKEHRYGITSIETAFSWKTVGLMPPNPYICRTHHKYHSGYEVDTYHIMVGMK